MNPCLLCLWSEEILNDIGTRSVSVKLNRSKAAKGTAAGMAVLSQFISGLLIYEQPVRDNVTFPIPCIIPGQIMDFILFRERGGYSQCINSHSSINSANKASVLPVKRVPPPFSNSSIEAIVSAFGFSSGTAAPCR